MTAIDTVSDLESTEHSAATDDGETVDGPHDSDEGNAASDPTSKHRSKFRRLRVAVAVLVPILAVVLASAAGALWWHDGSMRHSIDAQAESTKSAHDATVALLSYQPDTADTQLRGASALLTGDFKDAYTKLTNDVVIPGAKQKQIASVASVSAVSSVSATPDHAVSLVFVDQTVTVGNGAPTATSSAIRITMERIDNRWLISGFDPI